MTTTSTVTNCEIFAVARQAYPRERRFALETTETSDRSPPLLRLLVSDRGGAWHCAATAGCRVEMYLKLSRTARARTK